MTTSISKKTPNQLDSIQKKTNIFTLMNKKINLILTKKYFIFLSYFFLLLSFSLNSAYQRETNQGKFIFLTNQKIQTYQGFGDENSYARGGKELATLPNFKEKWYVNIWAPGMFALYALVYKINPEAPIALIFAAIVCLLWAGVFFQIYFLFQKVNKFLALLIPFTFFYFDFFRVQYLGVGVLTSETYSVALFFIGVYFYFTSHKNIKKMILAGFFLALAAYIRSHFEFSMRLFTMFIFFIAAVSILKQCVIDNINIKSIALTDWIKKGLYVALAFQLFTLPYRLHHTTPFWVYPNHLFAYNWTTDEEYNTNGASFVSGGGGNTACHVNPKKCQEFFERREEFKKRPTAEPIHHEEYQKELIQTFAMNPLEWFYYKIPIMFKFWFYDYPNTENTSNQKIIQNLVISLFLVLSFVSILIMTDFSFLLLCFSCPAFSFFAAYLLHIESRYFDLIKIISIYMFIIAVSILLKKIIITYKKRS